MSLEAAELVLNGPADAETVLKSFTNLCEEIRRFLREADRDGILIARELFLARSFYDKLVALGPKGSKTLLENEYETALQGLRRIIESIGETPVEPTGATRLRAAVSGHLLPAANKAKATAIVLTKEEERFAREVEGWLDDLCGTLAYAKLRETRVTFTNQVAATEAADKGQSAHGERRG